MQEMIHDDIEDLPLGRFQNIYEKLKSKPGKKYDFLVKGGEGLKAALYKLFQEVWRTETLQEGWTDSTISQIAKAGKPDIHNPANLRHIHDKLDIFKFFETIVVSYAKEKIYENMSQFQIACIPGHRASEHLYVIKSVVAYYNSKGKNLIFTSYDLAVFFDSEDIFDCLDEAYPSEIRGKVYRLLYKMNENIRIKVKTPLGI